MQRARRNTMLILLVLYTLPGFAVQMFYFFTLSIFSGVPGVIRLLLNVLKKLSVFFLLFIMVK